MSERFRSTTILCVKKKGSIAIAGDGQVSLGHTVLKGNAVKIRKIYEERVAIGFAGATADAFTLMERFEAKLSEYSGNLTRASVELAKDWRMDKMLRRLEAMMIATDGEKIYLLSGTGDVIEPEDNIVAIGSGGNYALAAARALSDHSDLSAREIVEQSMKIAADICVYTNHTLEVVEF